MISIKGQKVILKEANQQDIDEIYYWKYEDIEQTAKQWNGPYILCREIALIAHD